MKVIKVFASIVGFAAITMTLTTPGISQAGWLFNRCRGAESCCQQHCCGGTVYYPCNNCGQRYYYSYSPCNGCTQQYYYTYKPWRGYRYAVRYDNPVQQYVNTPQVSTPNSAMIRVLAPEGATVKCGGAETVSGSHRTFESPALTPGVDYTYDIWAQWRDRGGNQVTQIRRVKVSANSTTNVDLTSQSGG